MKILKCPDCGTLHPVDQKAKGTWCNCHNPAVHLDSRKRCVGTLRKRKVRQAEKLAKDLNMDLSTLLNDLLEMKSHGES